MRPSQLSSALRRIAAGIDSSRRPDRRIVAMDLRKVLAALGGDVQVRNTIYDNTQVTADEMVSALIDAMDGPVWFSQHSFGWIAVNRDPATLSPDQPVSGAPFPDEKTWGDVLANGYVANSDIDFRPYPSMQAVLEQNDDILWWMTEGDPAGQDELVAVLTERGLNAAAAKAAAFDI